LCIGTEAVLKSIPGVGQAADVNKFIGLNLTYAMDRMKGRKKSHLRRLEFEEEDESVALQPYD